jgi:protein ImuB
VPAAVLDATGDPVAVSGRGFLSAPPVTVVVGGEPPTAVTAWAGPWVTEERWWDPEAVQRVARLQVCTADGAARLLARREGRWSVEATYD